MLLYLLKRDYIAINKILEFLVVAPVVQKVESKLLMGWSAEFGLVSHKRDPC